jgi:hypothetical protein
VSDPSLSTEPKAIVCAICGCTISKHGRYNDEWWAHDDGTTDHIAIPLASPDETGKLDPKPWRCVYEGHDRERIAEYRPGFLLQPDPQYSQDLSAYENGETK